MDAIKILIIGLAFGLLMSIANIASNPAPTAAAWDDFINTKTLGEGGSNQTSIGFIQNKTTNTTTDWRNNAQKDEGSLQGTVLSTWEAALNVGKFITYVIFLFLGNYVTMPMAMTSAGTAAAGGAFPAAGIIYFAMGLFIFLFDMLMLMALIQLLIFRRAE